MIRAEHRAAADQGKGRRIPGTKIGNDQKGDKEDRRRAEVAHQPQQADAHAGQNNEQRQVPAAEQPFQRGGTGKNVADLGDLRGLEGQAAQRDPVGRTEFGLAQHQRDAQQADGTGGHEPPQLLHPFQIPQKQPQRQEQSHAEDDRQQLLGEASRHAGGRHRKGERGQVKRDGFQLKSHAAAQPQDGCIEPHEHRKDQKAAGNQGTGLLPRRHSQLHGGEDLEHCQPQKGRPHGGGAFRLPLLFQFLPLPNGLGQKHQRHAAQRNGVPQLHRSSVRNGPAIDRRTALGAEVVERPAPVIPPAQGCVLPGDAGVVQQHIGGFAPAENIFPMGQGDAAAIGQAQLRPDLRRMGKAQQRADGPDQDQRRQDGKQQPCNGRIPFRYQRVRRQPSNGLCKLLQTAPSFQTFKNSAVVYHFFHSVYSLPKKGALPFFGKCQ